MGKITWIKNDKIKTKGMLAYKLFGNSEVYDEIERGLGYDYEISPDIDLLHFKGITLNDDSTFKCLNKNTVLILENCGFGLRTKFEKGNIIIEYPKRNDDRTYRRKVEFQKTESLDLVLSSDKSSCEEWKYILEDIDAFSATGNAQDIEISMSCISNQLKSIKLENLYNLSINRWLEADKIEMKNSEITLNHSVEFKEIQITGSTITVPCSYQLSGKVEIKDSKIVCPKIRLADDIYIPENKQLIFSSNQEESGILAVARMKLISDLKAVSNKASTTCAMQEEDKKHQMEKRYESRIKGYKKAQAIAQSYQEYYANQIVEQQAAISEINKQLDLKMENIKNGLVKQRIRTVVPTLANKK